MEKKVKSMILIALIIGIIVIIGLFLSGAFNNEASYEKGNIIVLMGAGFSNVGEDLISEFNKKYPNIEINPRYAGSGQLFATLATQKTGDVFLPADYSRMEDAMKEGFIYNDTVQNVTKNIPTIAVEKGNPKNIHSLQDLGKDGVRVGIGEESGPAIGRSTAEILEKNNLTEDVSKNVVVTTSTVNQLVTYLVTGHIDGAIIWRDMISWNESEGKLEAIDIPENENVITTIPIGMSTFTTDKESAEKFIEFITSDEGKEIWEKWGYEVV